MLYIYYRLYHELTWWYLNRVYRIFDLSTSIGQPEQEYYLQPVEPGSSVKAASICPVDFSFGKDHLWDKFSVSDCCFILILHGFSQCTPCLQYHWFLFKLCRVALLVDQMTFQTIHKYVRVSTCSERDMLLGDQIFQVYVTNQTLAYHIQSHNFSSQLGCIVHMPKYKNYSQVLHLKGSACRNVSYSTMVANN